MAGTKPRAHSARPTPPPLSWSSQALRDPVRDPQGVGDDGQRRIDRAYRGKEARIGDVQVVDLVSFAVQVEHRGPGVGAEARRARLVRGAADGNVLAEIQRAMEKDGVVTGAVQDVFELALE